MDDPEAIDVAAAKAVCACTSVRRASRALTQLYDAALAPCGLTVTQYAVLAKLARLGPTSLAPLAEEMAMDRTTLTRVLAPLRRRGLVGDGPGRDRRARVVALTAAGEEARAAARPHWAAVQRRIAGGLGRERYDALLGELAALERIGQ